MDINMYDQDERRSHEMCWGSLYRDHQTWWFDNGELCRHPEWHDA